MRWTLLLAVNLCVLALGAAGQTPDSKPRVFIADSKSWVKRTPGIIKAFNKRCPGVTVTIKQEKADFVVLLDREAGGGIEKVYQVAVFNKGGDLIFSNSTRNFGNSVKDACQAIRKPSSPVGTAAPGRKTIRFEDLPK